MDDVWHCWPCCYPCVVACRSLWRHAVDRLNARPHVDWDAVDREKAKLEEAQRLLPVHQPTPGPWHTKVFHEVAFSNPVTGETQPFYTFDHLVRAALAVSLARAVACV